MKAVRLVLAALGALVLAACGGGSVQAPDFQGVLNTLTLTVPAGKGNPALGQTVQLDLRGHYTCQPGVSCPSTDTVTITDATYTASPSALATVDNTGLVTTKAPGTVTITAAKDGVTSNSVALQIGPAKVTSLVIRVPNADASESASDNTNAPVPVGGSQAFKVYGIYSNSPTPQDLSASDAVTWSSSNTGIATVAPANTFKTIATVAQTAVAGTTATLTAAVTLASGDTLPNPTAVVTVSGATLTSIQVTLNPATKSIGTGLTQQFQAIGNYSNNTTAVLDPSLLDWTSSDPSVATVDATGLATGVYNDANPISKDTTITATLKSGHTTSGNNTATATLTVLGSGALGCTELFPTASETTANVDPLICNLLGLNLIHLCGVDNPENVVDSDPTTFAHMYAVAGLLFQDYVSLTVKAPSTYAASTGSPRRAGFIVTNPTGSLVKADIVSQFAVTTLKNGIPQQTTDKGVYVTLPGSPIPGYIPPIDTSYFSDTAAALTVDLLGTRLNGSDAALLSIKATKDFDAVVLTWNVGLLGVLTDRDVFTACSNAVSATP